jgi:pyrroloquinoline quinone (PQQ) biosynthesis protein C
MSSFASPSWHSSLSPHARQRFEQLGSVKNFDPGQILIQKDAIETHLFLIESGTVEVQFPNTAGVQLQSGELLGEMAFVENSLRRNTVIALSPTRARQIERMELMTAFASNLTELREILDTISGLSKVRLGSDSSLAGTAQQYAEALSAESLRHRAVHHPYLQALAEGTFPDTRWALADFARQYYGYSAHFPRYLTTVISRLENPAHRRGLLENLTEESGVYEDEELLELAAFGVEREWIEGLPHPILFKRFSDAIGVVRNESVEADQVVCWREMFLATLSGGSPAEALGALGLGTENIVRTIYGPFVKAINRLGDLHPRDTVFFPLHTAVDDHHQATLQAISADFAATPEGRAGLRRGMLKALSLRSSFWDWLYARASNPAAAAKVL